MENLKTLLTEEQIAQRVKELGAQITKDFADRATSQDCPIFICMLKGSTYFLADLTRQVKCPLMIDFARISSYKNGTTSGALDLKLDITADISGRDVIIVEDIIDSGRTLHFYIEELKKKNPNSVKICTFLDKKERRLVKVDADYVGFDLPSGFVVGYGLDFAERFRELPYLAELLDPSKVK